MQAGRHPLRVHALSGLQYVMRYFTYFCTACIHYE
jgi:hypothetical protein